MNMKIKYDIDLLEIVKLSKTVKELVESVKALNQRYGYLCGIESIEMDFNVVIERGNNG